MVVLRTMMNIGLNWVLHVSIRSHRPYRYISKMHFTYVINSEVSIPEPRKFTIYVEDPLLIPIVYTLCLLNSQLYTKIILYTNTMWPKEPHPIRVTAESL